MTEQQQTDEFFMSKALEQAAQGLGHTRPNPPVGCVIVKNGSIIAEGFHAFAGAPHAEASALSKLPTEEYADSTLYVTLEPCSTTGRTPPCTEAILRAKVARVVIAALDPNPKHAGKAISILESAGIAVSTGILEKEATAQLAPFFKWITTKRPFVTLKMAQSLDGAIADHAGQSKWITGEEARKDVRTLRAKADAVLVGCNTACEDNPSLLRDGEDGSAQPGYRIILDSRGRVSSSAKCFTDGLAKLTIYATSEHCPEEHRIQIEATGATVWVLPTEFSFANQHPTLSLDALFAKAGEQGFLHILCEGGAELASSLLNRGLVDELIMYIAPKILGATQKHTFGTYPFDLPTAPRFSISNISQVGADVKLILKPNDLI